MLSWKVARCIRNSTMNVCVCDKLTGLRGAPRFIQSMGDQLPPICPPLHGATDRTLLYQTSAVCRIISRLGLMQDPPMERCQFVMWPQCRYCPINAALPLTDWMSTSSASEIRFLKGPQYLVTNVHCYVYCVCL